MKYAVVMALLSAAVFGVWQAKIARERADTLQAQIDGYEEAARIHRDYLVKMRDENARWDELTDDVLNMDGKNAPLPDYLRDASGRVWP